jgi:hypothetical protein
LNAVRLKPDKWEASLGGFEIGRKRSSAGLARLIIAQESSKSYLAWSLFQHQIAGRLTPARRATSNAGVRSAEKRTIFDIGIHSSSQAADSCILPSV